MFSYENEIKGKINIEKLWDLYSNVNLWHEWDGDIQNAKLDGEFTTGTKGTIFSNGFPPLAFILDEVERRHKFVNTSTLGDISVVFAHLVTDEGNGEYTIKHSVTITGPNDEQLQGMGKRIVANIPESMNKLLQLSKAA